MHRLATLFCVCALNVIAMPSYAQAAPGQDIPAEIQKLTDAMARTQTQLEESQRQLNEMREQLSSLRRALAHNDQGASPAEEEQPAATAATAMATAVEDIRERQAMQESQIATHEQTKVESESKYPVKISGMLLLNGFANTKAVDIPATPGIAVPGSGSSGASIRQTLLGINASGPHLFGADSYADLSIDFNGAPQYNSASSAYNSNTTLLRLRTAHAGLAWEHTKAYFSYDRPIFSPDTPTSLTAVALPALAWSGNLWNWNPQLGVSHDIGLQSGRALQLETAFVDVEDAPLTPTASTIMGAAYPWPISGAEASRLPGVEAHAALFPSALGTAGNRIGIGGYFAPHRNALGHDFDAWAATLDTHFYLPARLELTGNAYRGLALGGLGGGAYKDFAFRPDGSGGNYYVRSLDDVGGWAQVKEKLNERIEMNAALGLDNVFSGELRRYFIPGAWLYANLARNLTYTGNVIYSPTAYLLFSLEYRHLNSTPVAGDSSDSNVIGLGLGYKF